MSEYLIDSINIIVTVFLVFLNGYFVAAEFALVKLTESKIKVLQQEGKMFASTAAWLFKRQNLALSACQLGITMASLALGWIGEPAIAHLITPLIHKLGINSEGLIHGISFTIAFSIITSFHIIIGEQVPKIYAIRKPGFVFLWSAPLLKLFYKALYPFMYVLNELSNKILRWFGIEGEDSHGGPLSEEEIRASLSIAHAQGELTVNEHQLLHAVFKFDDEVARQIMLPRGEVAYLDVNKPFQENLDYAIQTKHTRFPVVNGSLDNIIGVVHMKDFLGKSVEDKMDLNAIARPAMIIPENILIGDLLNEFKQAKQHFAFVQDEHGTTLGIVTLENVLEELVGPVQDEFDNEQPEITAGKENEYIVDGETSIEEINEKLGLHLEATDSDTLSGLIVEMVGHKLDEVKSVKLSNDVEAELLETEGIRVLKLKLTLTR